MLLKKLLLWIKQPARVVKVVLHGLAPLDLHIVAIPYQFYVIEEDEQIYCLVRLPDQLVIAVRPCDLPNELLLCLLEHAPQRRLMDLLLPRHVDFRMVQERDSARMATDYFRLGCLENGFVAVSLFYVVDVLS